MIRYQQNAIKEAFDNLPCGICFFDPNGMVTLCNYQMHRLIFALSGRDLQSLPELQAVLNDKTLRQEQGIFLLKDNTAWRFSTEQVMASDRQCYTQVTASNVTELYRRQKELERDNLRLKEYGERMRRLSVNILSLIREEEALQMKMQVHDDIGRSVLATRQFLHAGRPMEEFDFTAWKNAVRLLKHEERHLDGSDALRQLTAAADDLGIRLQLDGTFPADANASALMLAAIRECMTNAVRHAGAKTLYVRLRCQDSTAEAVVTNDGMVPKGEIAEGGGLSSLRTRIEQRGGRMQVQSRPEFVLKVSVPVR